MTVEETFNSAVQHHDAHRLGEAEALYRQVLTHQPHHAPALRMLGLLAFESGRASEALQLLREALVLNPAAAECWGNLGVVLAAQCQLDEAVTAFHKAHDLCPDDAGACTNLANALQQKGRLHEAVALYHEARDLKPEVAEMNSNLARAYVNLGTALYKKGSVAASVEALRRGLRFQPNSPEALDYLGTALQANEQPAEAIVEYRRAIDLRPDFAEAHNNLANVLLDEDRLEEAEASYRRALELRPNYADAWSNLGNALQRMGRFHDAIAVYNKAAELVPGHAAGQFNLAWTLLQQGNFERGWALHDARLQIESELHGRRFSQPLWDGSPLNGRRILLHAEQGLGDTIQFIRYVQWVAGLGGVVIVETQRPLRRLLETMPETHQVVNRGEPLPDFEVQCPLMSLPRRHRTTLDTVPARVPYLYAEPSLVARWREAVRPDKFNVGMVWAGNPKPRHRSIALIAFSPLAAIPNVRFHSLQKGQPAEELRSAPAGMQINDLGGRLNDFAETAAVIQNLDLVITVDTAVAHLAGAMGKPVWVLLQSIPDWRWLLDRPDSPWYPTMRLFRQPTRGDWDSVVAEILSALADLMQNRLPQSESR